jgi:hypothetical protein
MSRDPLMEEPDLTPLAIPGNAEAPESLEDIIRRVVRQHVSVAADNSEYETFDEANDFEEEDPDPDLTSQYTVTELQDEPDGYPVDRAPEQDADQPPAEPSVGADEPPVEADGTPNTPPE